MRKSRIAPLCLALSIALEAGAAPSDLGRCPGGAQPTGRGAPERWLAGGTLAEFCALKDSRGKLIPHGPYVSWTDERFKLKHAEGQYDHGKRTGKWTGWHSSGHVPPRPGHQLVKRWEGAFVDDERQGEWTHWDERGKVQSKGRFDRGKQDGPWFTVESPTTQSERHFRKGVMHGPSKTTTGATVVEEIYENGLLHGPSVGRLRNGQKTFEGSYLQGYRHGPWSTWYPDGQLSSAGGYVRGQPDGPWKELFENGQVHREGTFALGKREGVWKASYRNGQRAWTAAYRQGKKQGEVELRDAGGKRVKVETYEDDVLVKTERSDGAGTLPCGPSQCREDEMCVPRGGCGMPGCPPPPPPACVTIPLDCVTRLDCACAGSHCPGGSCHSVSGRTLQCIEGGPPRPAPGQ